MMADDDHAEEERLAVIAKYDKGREEGAQIDDWEDPAFEIYHVTDRYGFIHDRVLPRLKADEIRRINVEQERADKWLKMIAPNKWPKFKNSEKLRSRIYKGIPDKMRVSAWKLLLDLDVIKKQQEGKYHEMYLLARKWSPDVRQIDLDVNRTYRDTRMFRERYGREQKALFNVLCAYSVYNSEVGYCQGMSQVAALLLMYMEEEDAFWALSQLMTNPKYGMHGFFIAGFPKLLRFQAHHDRVLKVMMPRLKKHFDKHGVDCGLYTLKWFFQCFLDRVPFELSLRLWDIFLLEGDRVLICGAYAILRMHQKQLLARKNMDDILAYIQTVIPANFGVELDKAILNYQQYAEDLRSRKLDTGGEPSDDELPKKPFGVIEIKPAPVKRHIIPAQTEKPQVTHEEAISFDEADEEDEEPDAEVSIVEKYSRPSTATSTHVDSPSTTPVAEGPPAAVRTVPTATFPSSIDGGRLANGPTEHAALPAAKMNGLSHSIPARKTSPSPPPPPPRSPQPGASISSASSSTASRHTNRSHSSNRHTETSHFGVHSEEEVTLSSSSRRVPPPVMPRKPLTTSQVHEGSEGEDLGGRNIPSNSAAVRIHVPYSSSQNHNNHHSNSATLSSPATSHSSSTSPVRPPSTASSSSSSVDPRSLDLSKNDPNRIKIDVSSRTNSTLIQ